MATTTKATAARFVKRSESGIITNTQWLAAMAGTADGIKTAAWRRAYTADSRLPLNNPSLPSHDNDAYDAFQQSGAAVADTGEQTIFMGAAAYRITLPAGQPVQSVAFRLAADKFLVGGLRIAAVLTSSAMPPDDWELCTTGGVENIVDATGKFATPKTKVSVDPAPEVWDGILATTASLVSKDKNKTTIATLDLSGEVAAHAYLYLIISLFDPGRWRREYYAEGSGLIDGSSIALTFAADGVEMPEDADAVPIRLAVQQTGASKRVTFSANNYNLENGYLRLHWGARMLLSGFVDPLTAVTTNSELMDGHKRLAPRVAIAGLNSTATAEYVEVYCAEPLIAGYTLWIRAAETSEGTGKIRVTVLDAAEAVDVTSQSVWNGTSALVIGTALTSPVAGEWVAVPITKNAKTSRLQILASVAEIPAADAERIAVGFPNLGFDLVDMHAAKSPAIAAAPALPAYGILTLAPDASTSGDILRAIRGGMTASNPISDRGLYSLTKTASACVYGTSLGPWLTLAGDPAPAFTYSHLGIWAGDGYFLALDSYTRKWYQSGALPVALSGLTNTTTSAFLDRIIVDGGTVAWVDETNGVGIKTAGTTSAWKTAVEAWTDAMIIAKAGNITVAICDNGGTGTLVRAYTMNDSNGAMKTALEAVVDAYDVVVDFDGIYHRVIFRMIDGTVKAYRWFVQVTEETATATWVDVADVGVAAGLFWGISGNDLLCSGTKPAWADDSAIPAGKTRTMLISGTARLGIAYH